MYCPNCGTESNNAKFCTNCGTPLTVKSTEPSNQESTVSSNYVFSNPQGKLEADYFGTGTDAPATDSFSSEQINQEQSSFSPSPVQPFQNPVSENQNQPSYVQPPVQSFQPAQSQQVQSQPSFSNGSRTSVGNANDGNTFYGSPVSGQSSSAYNNPAVTANSTVKKNNDKKIATVILMIMGALFILLSVLFLINKNKIPEINEPETDAFFSLTDEQSQAETEKTEKTKKVEEGKTKKQKLTDTQQKAATLVQQTLNFGGYSRAELIQMLRNIGYSEEDAAAAVDSVSADWKAQAAKKSETYLMYTNYSRKNLIKRLVDDGFSDKDAEEAVDSLKIDWDKQAEKEARFYVDNGSFTYELLIEELEDDGFTNEQAVKAAKAVGY